MHVFPQLGRWTKADLWGFLTSQIDPSGGVQATNRSHLRNGIQSCILASVHTGPTQKKNIKI